MRRSLLPLAALVLYAVAAHAESLPLRKPSGGLTALSHSESCTNHDPTTASARLDRSARFTGAALADLLADAASATTEAELPRLRMHVVATEDRRINSVNNVTTKRAWNSSCTGPLNCFSTTVPTSGDWVRIVVTMNTGVTSTRFYGNFSNGSVTTSLNNPLGATHTQDVFDLTLNQGIGVDALTHGLDPAFFNQIQEIDILTSVEANLSVECNPAPNPTASLAAKAKVDYFGVGSEICYDRPGNPCV